MADEFLDDALNAESRRLIAELRGLERQVAADNRVTKDNLATENRQSTKRDRQIAREEAVQRRSRRSSVSTLEADLEAQRARDAERRLAAERQITRQTRAQSDEFLRRRQLPPAGGTGVGRYGGLTPAEEEIRRQRGLTTTGLFGGGPPPPPRPPTAAAGGDDESYRKSVRSKFATDELNKSKKESIPASRAAVGAERDLTRELQRAGIQAELYSNRYRKHGALTTEFIEAARRGEVDIRELGYQVTATIGKFAGWTLAAASVYGVASALSAMGQGAIESLNGVNQLQRIITTGLDTEQVQREFRGLSEEFNLPIGQVSQAAYEMSKVFGQGGLQPVLEGTRATLFAVKVGELEAAQATQFLTSIINGFGLEAGQLPAVMDSVNQATNKFGGNVGSMVQGVANASGAFRAAGGNFRDLIALVETGQKVTGRSGSEIGTALRRTAEISQRPERRLTIMRLLGLDPRDTSVTDLLARAAQVIRHAGPDVRSQVLRAITTPELASGRILPILQNFDLYQKVRREVEPDRSRGSAERELQRTLRAPGEELSRFTNELQRFGSTLAQIGALDPFILGLKTINRTLNLATDLLGVFTLLPRPIRTAVALLAQGAAAVALMRRLDVGKYVPGQPTVLRRGQGARDRVAALSGLRGFQAETNEDLRREGVRNVSLRRQAQALENIGADEKKITRANEAITESNERRAILAHQQSQITREISDVERGRASFAYRADTLVRDPNQVPGAPVSAVTPGGVILPTGVAREAGQLAANAEKAVDAQRIEQTRMSERLRRYSIVGRGLDAASLGLINAGRGSKDTFLRAGTRLQQAGGQLTELSRSLTILDKGIIGITAAVVGGELLKGLFDDLAEQHEAAAAAATSVADQRRQLESGLELQRQRGENLGQTHGPLAFVGRQLQSSRFLPFTAAGSFLQDIAGTRAQDEQNAVDRARAIQQQQEARRGRLGTTRRAPGLFLAEVAKDVRSDISTARNIAEQRAFLNRSIDEARQSIERSGSRRQRQAVRDFILKQRQALAELDQISGDLAQAFRDISTATGLKTALDAGAAETTLRGPNQRSARTAALAIRRAYTLLGEGAITAAEAAEQVQAADALAQQQLEPLRNRLSAARRPAARARILEQILEQERARLITQPDNRVNSLQEDINRRRERIARLAGRVGQRAQTQRATPGTAFGPLGGDLTDLQTRQESRDEKRQTAKAAGDRNTLKRLRAEQNADRQELKRWLGRRKLSKQEFRLLLREERDQQFEFEAQIRESRQGAIIAGTNDPLQQARLQLQFAGRELQLVIRQYGRGTQQFYEALANQRQAAQAAIEAELSRGQLTRSVATAQFAIGADDAAVLQRQLSDAQANLADAQSRGASPETILQLQQTVFEIQGQIADQAKQEAEDMIGAIEELRLAQAGEDPVRQAQIRLRAAQQRLALAKTPAERLRGRADVINNRTGLRDARLNERLDERQFQYDMGRLTRDQYIGFLERFLRNNAFLRKTNREWYRRLRLQLRQLRQGEDGERSEFELNVGDIRLPTVYEVRRALGGSAASRRARASASVTNNNSLVLNIARDADMAAVARVLDDYTSGGVKEAARAAGVIG